MESRLLFKGRDHGLHLSIMETNGSENQAYHFKTLSFFLAEYPAGLERNHNLCSAQQMTLQSRSSSYCINILGSLREEKIAKIKAQYAVFRRHTQYLIAISFLYSLFFPPGVAPGSSFINSNKLHQ